MKACLRARCTHHKALHEKLSIHPARGHDQEAKHGKNNLIACMDQLQQPWQNWIICKQSASKTFCSKGRARKWHATLHHNCNQGHEWIEDNHIFKTSLLKYLKICMDISVASSLHGIKITAEQGLKSATSQSLVYMLVLVTTLITKIHGIHLWKDGMV